MPTLPRVAMNANARGTPAKLEATPEKVTRKLLHASGQTAEGDGVRKEEAEHRAAQRAHEAHLDGERDRSS